MRMAKKFRPVRKNQLHVREPSARLPCVRGRWNLGADILLKLLHCGSKWRTDAISKISLSGESAGCGFGFCDTKPLKLQTFLDDDVVEGGWALEQQRKGLEHDQSGFLSLGFKGGKREIKGGLADDGRGPGEKVVEATMEFSRRRKVIGHSKSEYGHPLQLYVVPPTENIPLSEFETFAVERLKLLKTVENLGVSYVKGSEDYNRKLSAEISSLSFPYRTEAADDQKPAEYEKRRKDHVSHFILRLAYCQTEDLRRWFIQQEMDLFRHRFTDLSSKYKTEFLHQNDLRYDTISKEEKKVLMDKLVHSAYTVSGTTVLEQDFYRVPFQDALDLVRTRKVFLRAGYAYIAHQDIVTIVLNDFRTRLSKALALTARSLPTVQSDERLQPLLSHLSSHTRWYTHTAWVREKENGKCLMEFNGASRRWRRWTEPGKLIWDSSRRSVLTWRRGRQQKPAGRTAVHSPAAQRVSEGEGGGGGGGVRGDGRGVRTQPSSLSSGDGLTSSGFTPFPAALAGNVGLFLLGAGGIRNSGDADGVESTRGTSRHSCSSWTLFTDYPGEFWTPHLAQHDGTGESNLIRVSGICTPAAGARPIHRTYLSTAVMSPLLYPKPLMEIRPMDPRGDKGSKTPGSATVPGKRCSSQAGDGGGASRAALG
ncbi:hypothetical protein SKAU_G00165250 [Synaphobranchus kaupii]|uniref:DNA primase large subunit n=1 Tax=Synaphobranchus kaupii TaxID=118154 RepID=A0A9Q1J056_SYNKA|nr:hypothetical protein SKAU_G00165250 [Synaphobranchus kaupii]